MKLHSLEICLIVAMVVCIMLATCNSCKPHLQPTVNENILQYQKDSLESRNHAIVMEYNDFKKASLRKEDSLLKLIQTRVNKNTVAAIGVSIKTTEHFTGPTVVAKRDTVKGDCNPEYTFEKSDKWSEVHAVANRDSFTLDFTSKDILFIHAQWERRGLFKAPDLTLTVENMNPHSRTIDQQAFIPAMPKPKRLIWLGGGVVIGVGAAAYLLLK